MSKNAIHNFNLSIKNSADIKSSEHLTETIIKELAKVSKEINQQKDIVQVWQEQKSLNTTAIVNNSSTSIGEGATNTTAEAVVSTTSTVAEGTRANLTVSTEGGTNGVTELFGNTFSVAKTRISTLSASIGEGVADTTGSTIMSSPASVNTTSPTLGAGNNALNFSNSTTTQTYANVAAQQTLRIPQMLQTNSEEPTIEAVIAEIKKKLTVAINEKDFAAIAYWTSVSKAFDEKVKVQDFYGKPNNILFTEMYAALKRANQGPIISQNFNWDVVRKKMVESIDANILNGKISDESKTRWKIIKAQLLEDKTDIANLFEQYDELFLLLKEVEGLEALPNTITITTKTKIYPNLSADKTYPAIGKEAVYVFLKEITDATGRAVKKGAVKIKNTDATSFIVGESLEFILDEAFVKQHIKHKKEDINWIVYHVETKGSTIFRDKGTSFNYNFDKSGTYRVDAYGQNATVKGNKNAPESTFIELNIVAQQIIITSPGITKDGLTRTSVKEKLFKIALKYPKIKTLNPLKLYYQVETKTGNKVTIISEEQELGSADIVKFSTPNLGEYCIKVISKDQYVLNKEYKINAIKNEVTSIGQAKEAPNKGRFLLGASNNTLTLEAKTFKINPTDEDKEGVKWMIYDSNNKPYLPSGSVVLTDDNNPKKAYLHKWNYFDVPLPKKAGNYTVEAYSDSQKGAKAKSVFSIEMMQPRVSEAYWASGGGSKKRVSGFEGESNWIKANIPYYNNQIVRIYFYLDTKKTKYYLDTKTNEKGEIFQEIKFDSNFQKQIEFPKTKNNKIGFKVLGIQNGKPYPFKTPANYESNTVLSVTTDTKIIDAYFMYDDKRVTSQDEIPFDKKGTTVTIVAKTQNMVGKEIVLTAHKVGEKPAFRHRVIVNSEGVATTKFDIMPAKGVKNGTVNKYYVGIEGYSTKHLTDKMINMVVGSSLKSTNEILDENNPLLVWGGKVNKDFRVKVVQICKRLWPKNTLEMANGLMAVMNRETGGTFAPHQIEGKKLIPKEQLTKDSFITYDKKGNRISHAVGLVQFTQKALTDMGEYKGGGMDVLNELKLKFANMTQLEQLTKVEDYMNAVAILPTIPEEIYMAVFAPAYVGRGLDKTIYELGTTNYNENASLDVDKTKNGIQIKELIDEYYISLENGKYGRNVWRNPLDKMDLRGWYKFGWSPNESDYLLHTTHRSKGKHLGLDLYAPIGTPVYACVDGTALILFPPYSDTFGLHVRIEGYYNEKKYNFFYAHLSEIKVKNFQKVKAGTLIGYTGQTGEAEGQPARFNHLHFEVRNSRENRGATLEPLKEISDLSKNVNINPSRENQNG